MLTADDLDQEELDGAKFVCSPPPRDKPSQDACWEGLEQGVFDLFSSDHCPFRFNDPEGKLNEKGKRNFRWIPNGIPGVATRLPILFSEGVMKGRIDINRFVAVTSTNHAKLYGLYPQKGTIAIGSDADIALWDRCGFSCVARRLSRMVILHIVTWREATCHAGSLRWPPTTFPVEQGSNTTALPTHLNGGLTDARPHKSDAMRLNRANCAAVDANA